MSFLLMLTGVEPEPWVEGFRGALPEMEIRVWPDSGPPEAVDYALLWLQPHGLLGRFSHLKAIFSFGAGVDRILADPSIRPEIPIVRLIDPGLTTGMVEYVVHRVLHYHRRIPEYEAMQRRRDWRELEQPLPDDRTIGFLGLGVLGTACAQALAGLGFDVAGWSRTPKKLPGIDCLHGEAGFGALLERSDIVVALLPSTADTRGILDARAFARMKRGAWFINVGRGSLVVDDDLLAALDRGHLAGATLDVFQVEPLPVEHRYWSHPLVSVTPHVAAYSQPKTVVRTISEQIRAFEAGRGLPHAVDRARGY